MVGLVISSPARCVPGAKLRSKWERGGRATELANNSYRIRSARFYIKLIRSKRMLSVQFPGRIQRGLRQNREERTKFGHLRQHAHFILSRHTTSLERTRMLFQEHRQEERARARKFVNNQGSTVDSVQSTGYE